MFMSHGGSLFGVFFPTKNGTRTRTIVFYLPLQEFEVVLRYVFDVGVL